MSREIEAALLAWSIPFWTTLALDITAILYVRGWLKLRQTRRTLFPAWRMVCFLAGLLAIFLAVASPFDTLDDQLLSAHMVQHFLFMSVAPPLLLLGYPQVPLLRGLPRIAIRRGIGPLFRQHWLRRLGSFVTSLKPAWILMNLSYIGWHIPAAYELALRSQNWHNLEHGCFFFTSVFFWWPLIRPWPMRNRRLRWMLLPYILSADFVNTGISALFCFFGRPVYPTYIAAHNILGVSALSDQIAAGAFMWVAGSTVFLVPAFWITVQLLSPGRRRNRQAAMAAYAGMTRP